MSDRLAKLESQIERFVEGTLTRLLAGRLQAREVAVRLARAMEDHSRPGPRDARLAPLRYRVRLNPEDAAALQQASPDLTSGLCAELLIFARELNLALPGRPIITIESDPAIELNGIVVEAGSAQPLAETRPISRPLPEAEAILSRAYLILNGDRHVPLNRPVITLGRKLDNTIIIDDPRVSRHHAQLRQRFGRWILYDLGSASGTYVNNHRIEECILQVGDVISFSGATLIYGEDEPTGTDDTGGTLPLPARSDPDPPPPVRG
ncbi:MAG TPA: DUF3662 and FHA domain-containing protein [Anaerolineales bacterium]|nr:DUF3662 and FHA domain-containing protein [Anaerolineales bacterium]